MRVDIRHLDALAPELLGTARALCHTARAAELFDRALAANAECRGQVALTDDGSLAGVALSGFVAGALGTGALLWVAVQPRLRRRGIGRALVAGALGGLDRDGARLVVAELAGDTASGPIAALLAAAGFEREAEIADFYRDGVPLTLLRRQFR